MLLSWLYLNHKMSSPHLDFCLDLPTDAGSVIFFFFNFLFNLVVLSLSVLILLCSSSRANTVCDCAATELPHPIPFLLPDQDLRQLRYSLVESSIDYSVVLAKSQ